MRLQDLRDLPPTVSVEQAAAILGVGRGTAFNMAREFLATGYGLPVLKFGRRLLVPVPRLLALLGVEEGERAEVPSSSTIKGPDDLTAA